MYRAYEVGIKAVQEGKRVEFVEVVKIYVKDNQVSVPESKREQKAIQNVKERMPLLQKVQATWSCRK